MASPILKIEKVVQGGEGLGHLNGYVVFVPGVLPGERVRIRWVERKKDFGRARAMEILEPSPHRIDPDCPIFDRCGGCQWQMTTYSYQLTLKTEIVRDAFRRIAKLQDLPLEEIVPSPKQWRYRSKLQMPVKKVKGRLLMGFYEPGTHYVVDAQACPVAIESLDRLVSPIKELLDREPLSIYNETAHYGKLRHVVLRGSEQTGETLVVFVTKEWGISKELALKVERLDPEHIIGVAENRNPERTNRIFGFETRKVIGNPFYLERIHSWVFRVSATSFFQVNVPQLTRLLDDLRRLLENEEVDTLVDAHTGVGVFAIGLSDLARRVIGIEMLGPAVVDAQDNLERNDALNVEFQVGKAEDLLPGIERFDVLLLDPPRKGIGEGVLNAIQLRKPRRILYVSCNPVSLAKNTRQILDLGYDLVFLRPYDFFPQTFHVETLACFVRRDM